MGNSIFCNICQKTYSKFIVLENGDKLCPACGSLPRHRRLWKIINDELPISKQDFILHFSPEKCIIKKLKATFKEKYHTTDYDKSANTQFHFDITDIAVKDESYSYSICYHVLEHIENDSKAIKELYRILKKGGKTLIQTPFKEGEIYENSDVKTPEARLKHFGQEDHVRIYSILALQSRLESAGFKVQLKQYNHTNETHKMGFKSNETVLICEK